MKCVFFAAVILFQAGISVAEGQIVQTYEYSVLPLTEILPTIVYQEESPLRIEKFVVAKSKTGNFRSFYTVRNIGKKEIRYYKVARWYSDNTGYIGDGIMPKSGRLKPQQLIGTMPKMQMIPDASSQSSTNSQLKKIIFIMVVEIGFSDKTVLSFEKEFVGLESHLKRFETIYDAPSL
ncbi:MAG: hypothetical protein IGR93_08575 [Hydrococcus sp. C42_A2020_068]|jgi:hypothetical protein|nr:hypothetical protein [Hydrococcus sp. C42_A2020_068]